MPDCPELQRVTTEYVMAEDRIRLSGATADDQTVVLWLTQRLLNRLAPTLTGWLEQHEAADQLLQGFAQQAAELSLPPETAVAPVSPDGPWRADLVDVATGPDGVMLTFRSEDTQAAALPLPTQALRQWLGIVHGLYVAAEWPTAVWPAWMDEARSPPPKPAGAALH
jgi:hypothetical protein